MTLLSNFSFVSLQIMIIYGILMTIVQSNSVNLLFDKCRINKCELNWVYRKFFSKYFLFEKNVNEIGWLIQNRALRFSILHLISQKEKTTETVCYVMFPSYDTILSQIFISGFSCFDNHFRYWALWNEIIPLLWIDQ